MPRPNIANFDACIHDARRAVEIAQRGPPDPVDYYQLIGRLAVAREKLPPVYRKDFADPYIVKLQQLTPMGFASVLMTDPRREGAGRLMLDLAHAILQNGERYQEHATDGFQEVISDLYDGFLSEEDRRGVKLPDRGVMPPLAKWGGRGPYTWPITAAQHFAVKAAVVSLPAANAHTGLLAWASLPHETSGHDILHADDGLHADLANNVRQALNTKNNRLADYWADRVDETASDVLGILNMGPAAAIGLIGYFRALRAAQGGAAKLSNRGERNPRRYPHPLDILRGYLAASTVELLSFKEAPEWAKVLKEECDKDLEQIVIGNETIDNREAQESAAIVAETLVKISVKSLENHSLGDIQDWNDWDEDIVSELGALFYTDTAVADVIRTGYYAAHVVAAAIVKALEEDAELEKIFSGMLDFLKAMHDANPSWGPLYVVHPGDISPVSVW